MLNIAGTFQNGANQTPRETQVPQNCKRIASVHTLFTTCASRAVSDPSLRCKSICSKESKRDRRTVEGTRRPSDTQSQSGTSVADRGGADVTAATTASRESNHSINTGRIFDPNPLVKRISASQISPGSGIVVEPFVGGYVTIQEGAVIANCGRFRSICLGRGSRFLV